MMTDSFVAVDLETTGLNPSQERIIEIGAVKVKDGVICDTFDVFVNPERTLSSFITELTGITDEMLNGAPDILTALHQFLEFAGEEVLVGHHISFDYSFLKKNIVNIGENFEREGIDTLKIARECLPNLEKRSLTSLCAYYGIENAHAHRACEDAMATTQLYFRLKKDFYGKENRTDQLFIPVPLKFQVKKDSPVTPAQIRYLKALAEYHHLELEVKPESLTKSEASKRIDHMILHYGKILDKRERT